MVDSAYFPFIEPRKPELNVELLIHSRSITLCPLPSDCSEQVDDLRMIKARAGILARAARLAPFSAAPGDIAGSLLLALLKARRSFDPSRGTASFSTYAFCGHAQRYGRLRPVRVELAAHRAQLHSTC